MILINADNVVQIRENQRNQRFSEETNGHAGARPYELKHVPSMVFIIDRYLQILAGKLFDFTKQPAIVSCFG